MLGIHCVCGVVEYKIEPTVVFQIFRPLLPWTTKDSTRLALPSGSKSASDSENEPEESLEAIAVDFLGEERKGFAKFFSFFWSFALPDLKVPESLYKDRIALHKDDPSLCAKLKAEFSRQNDNCKHCKELSPSIFCSFINA